jgi:hypothetical protein
MCSELCVNNKKDLIELKKNHIDLLDKMKVQFWISESAKRVLKDLRYNEKSDIDSLKKAKRDLKTAKILYTRAFNLSESGQWDNSGFYIYHGSNQIKDSCSCAQTH